ncbi:uncharacterized protein LY89DRAFT_731169 [Mollisia scopiformis]|uniref:Zn(2)-C6 fungal-type domain-containing protein n=1 Tax=Mollisia scopiformis TaxID=149040 RepID=A0A194XID8_MOLSC|nr:uncharacterized protein LY89DRAFT_731169 [Mollisia scopiformis]KUJ19923.1 hypothetical protein LY89DRAFT_731169 [Mollisia scopiformis]
MSSDGSAVGLSDSAQKVPHACSSCRRQKKGCDKAFPSCSACLRLRRACVYDAGPSPPLPENFESLARRLSNLEHEMNEHRALCETKVDNRGQGFNSEVDDVNTDGYAFPGSSAFPSVFFLDVNVFRRHRLKAPTPQVTVQDNIFREIGDDVEIRATVGEFFFSVSPWMAIVAKKQFYQEISALPIEMAPDVTLLLLCMKLIIQKPDPKKSPRTHLFAVTKNFYLTVESSGFASMRLLQAAILISLYETGHAIYPQAYISIGHVARLGQAIGLHDTDRPQLALEPGNWEQMEERRRVWWAVYILDRHVNIGNPSRSLALAETGRKEYLPVDDKAWERGDKVASEPLFVSSSTNIAAAPYARLCQASHLLSLVLTYVNDNVSSASMRLEEAQQLARAVLSLCTFMQTEVSNEATRICVPMAICYSALIVLYEHASNNGQTGYSLPEEEGLRDLGVSGLHGLIPLITEYAIHIQTILPYNIDQASPFICNCLYRFAVWISGMADASAKSNNTRAIKLARDTLEKLSQRWMVAEYLKILDDFELGYPAADAMALDVAQNAYNPSYMDSSSFVMGSD